MSSQRKRARESLERPFRHDFTVSALFVATVLVVLAGCQERSGGATPQGAAARGAAYYSSLCATCHGAAGQGFGVSFPPLAGSEWVIGDEERLIRVVLYGLQGPTEVKGKPYRGLMVGFERQLGDEDMAALLTFIRSSWGNDAPAVDPADVTRVREGGHPGMPLQGSELD